MRQDYVDARFLEWWSYHPRVLVENMFPAWMQYECKIADPMQKTEEMIQAGYLQKGTFEEQLSFLTVPELKEIATEHSLPKKKKKQELIDIILERCAPEQVSLNTVIKISEKGVQFMNANGVYSENDPMCIEPYLVFDEKGEIIAFNREKYNSNQGTSSNPFSLVSYERIEYISNYGFCYNDFSIYNVPNTDDFKRFFRIVMLWGEIKGKGEDKMVSAITKRYPMETNDARMLVRTEHTYICAQTELASLKDAGFTEYQFRSLHEERDCEHCDDLDGQIFPIDEATAGINLPPIHPMCRCRITCVPLTVEEIEQEIDDMLRDMGMQEGEDPDEFISRKVKEQIAADEQAKAREAEENSVLTAGQKRAEREKFETNSNIVIKYCGMCGSEITQKSGKYCQFCGALLPQDWISLHN